MRKVFLTLGDGQGSIAWVEITAFSLEDQLVFSIPGYVYNRGLYCDVVPYMLISVFFQGSFSPLSSKFKYPDDGLDFSVACCSNCPQV